MVIPNVRTLFTLIFCLGSMKENGKQELAIYKCLCYNIQYDTENGKIKSR